MSPSAHDNTGRPGAGRAEPGPGDTLRELVEDLTPEDDEELADRIRVHADTLRSRGDAFTLEECFDAVPWLHECVEALDAAIDETIESALAGGARLEAVSAALLHDHPAIARSLRRATILRSGIAWECESDDEKPLEIASLPCDFGPTIDGGKPRYEIRSVIGVGGQAVVYSALDRLFSEPHRAKLVAVKIFHPDPYAAGRSSAQDGMEAKRVGRIAHNGIVRVVDRGVTPDGTEYAAFEQVEGLRLDEWLDAHPNLSLRERVRLVADIAEAIEAAHACGVVHRDIKPTNILMDHNDRPKVADFGISRDVGLPLDNQGNYTSKGSLAFMSPEHYLALPENRAPSTDVYGVGGLLYWFLTDRFPNGDTVETAMSQLEADPTAAREYPSDVPFELRVICERALDHDPRKRHQSIAAFRIDLADWLHHRPIHWIEQSRLRKARLLVRRNPAASLAATLAVLALLGGSVATSVMVMRAAHDRELQEIELREMEARAESRLHEQQAADSESRIEQSRAVISKWAGLISGMSGQDPERYIALMTSLGSIGLTGDDLRLQLYSDTRESALKKAEEVRQTKPGSLEAALWISIAGVNSCRAGNHEEGAALIREGRDLLRDLVGESDPLVERLWEILEQCSDLEEPA